MVKDACKKPCGECPFKVNSIKGWLGGFSLEETLQTASADADFLCHVSGRGDVKKQCAGRMLFASKTAKMFRDEDLEKLRLEIKELNPNFREEILGFEIRNHHKLQNKMKTQEEVDRQIEGLQEMRDSLPQYNAFNDDNWAPIDTQLAILRQEAPYEDYENEEYEIESAAYLAKQWLEGEHSDDLFDND